MRKKIFTVIIFLTFILMINGIAAGNNTTVVDNPTTVYVDSNETVIALESGDSNIQFSNGYKGYCIEWGEHSAEEGEVFYITNSSNAINKITNEDVSNHLKTMFLFFYNKTQENPVVTQHMIWKFTDNKQFSKFDKEWYNNIIELSSKYKIPDSGIIKINETHEVIFNFKVFVAQYLEYQNYFAYRFIVQQIDMNESNQIINSTMNNLTTNLTTDLFSEGSIQYNGTYTIKIEKEIKQSTLSKYKTGINTNWMFFCIIILLIVTYFSYNKS